MEQKKAVYFLGLNMAERTATISTYIASGMAIALGFMNEYAAAFGVLIAMLTFIVNLWFKWAQLQEIKKHGIDKRSEIIQ